MNGRKPNVLIIMCDQLNAGVLSCYGGPVKALNLERLASAGVVFENAFCTTPICTPTRASILTGKYPHNHGIVGNVWRNEYPWFRGVPVTEEGIREDDLTTEKILSQNGYHTVHFGKWHVKGDEDLSYYPEMYREHYEYAEEMSEKFQAVRRLPEDQWLDWYGWALPVKVPEVVKAAVRRFEESGSKIQVHPFTRKIGLLEMDLEDTFDCRVVDRTLSFLRNTGDEPFMLTCSLNVPHDPNVLPLPFYGMFPPEDVMLPENFKFIESLFENELSRNIVKAYGEDYVREFLSIYYSSVLMLDHFVGQILDTLEDKGLKENTIVLFVSDHGDMAGGHGMVWKSTSAFYDEIARQAMILSYPARLKPGRCRVTASAVDVLPTLVDLCGFCIPEDIDGVSLVPYLEGIADSDGLSRYVYCEKIDWNKGHTREVFPGTPASFMMRNYEWKYIRYHNGTELLYHLTEDPGEIRNLSSVAEYEEVKRELCGILSNWLNYSGFRI
ncbi:MAG TPA: sulfatase-like hydrolase/transferase [Clostridiales bacterium]|nr:sulfatase-like hydrolase/transferase [Clostridiales bacterium]